MSTYSSETAGHNSTKWMFLATYAAACFGFWWLSPLLFRILLGEEQGIDTDVIWISIFSLFLFVFGYFIPWRNRRPNLEPTDMLQRCAAFAYKATLIIAVPALLLAAQFTISRSGFGYVEGPAITLQYQAILYTHLFFGLLFLGAAEDDSRNRRRVYLVSALTILPRVIVSIHWGRFFAAQAIIPIVFIALARGWIKVTAGRLMLLGGVGLCVVIVPAMTRGDKLFGVDDQGRPDIVIFFEAGNTLKYLQDHRDLPWTCPPLLVSITSKTVPYHLLGVCTIDIGDDKDLPATLDILLTKAYTDNLRTGTGGNFLLDLDLLGGMPAIIVGTVLFGFTCRRLVEWIARPSIYAGIWAECISRAFLAPRGNLGYTFERIPSLVVATLLVAMFSWASYVLRTGGKHIAVTTRDRQSYSS